MGLPFFQLDKSTSLHRGAIYHLRPIFWLEPPLWILRDHNWTIPRSASLNRITELSDAFQGSDSEEDVLAKAKIRPLIILSNDKDINSKYIKEVIVAPIYSIKPEHPQDFLDKLKQGIFPDLFYIPADQIQDTIKDSYINFRQVRALKKEFLESGKLDITLSMDMLKAILNRYQSFFKYS